MYAAYRYPVHILVQLRLEKKSSLAAIHDFNAVILLALLIALFRALPVLWRNGYSSQPVICIISDDRVQEDKN